MPFAHHQLRVSPDNPRKRGLDGPEDVVELEELALNIGRRGLFYALRVTAAGFIDGGQRRHLAIGKLIAWARGQAPWPAEVEPAEIPALTARAEALAAEVPCVVIDPASTSTMDRIADNVQRAPMHTYDIAEAIVRRLDLKLAGDSQTKIAREIGRSLTYVSRLVSTYRGACPELHEAWGADRLAFDRVRALAELPHDRQRAELAGTAPRGSHGRPGVDRLKALRARALRRVSGADPYMLGLVDGLSVATGDQPPSLIEDRLPE